MGQFESSLGLFQCFVFGLRVMFRQELGEPEMHDRVSGLDLQEFAKMLLGLVESARLFEHAGELATEGTSFRQQFNRLGKTCDRTVQIARLEPTYPQRYP